MGRIPYLEKVTGGGLGKLNAILQELRSFARHKRLKLSWTGYNKWGKGKKIRLRFSKSGSPYMENLYATHYVRPVKKPASVNPPDSLTAGLVKGVEAFEPKKKHADDGPGY
jgi:hypothetical protein